MQPLVRPTIQTLGVLSHIPSFEELLRLAGPLKGICFDMDGTLLNSEPLHASAIWRMLPQKPVVVGEHFFENEDQLNHFFYGQCDADVFEALRAGQPAWHNWQFNDFSNQKNTGLLTKSLQNSNEDNKVNLGLLEKALVPEMLSLLKQLKDAGVSCALVSASQEEVVHDFVDSLRLNEYFKVWIGATAEKLTKPHPDPYLEACAVLGLSPKECVALEDSPTGLQSAHAAGLKVLHAKWF